MEKYGVEGIAPNLFKSYLLNWKQYTVVNDKKSNNKSIKCGVPQGSTLGPLLFIIYMNDLPNASKFNTTLFADDTCLTITHKSAVILEKTANTEISKVADWLSVIKLSLNYKKLNYLLSLKEKRNKKLNYTLMKT